MNKSNHSTLSVFLHTEKTSVRRIFWLILDGIRDFDTCGSAPHSRAVHEARQAESLKKYADLIKEFLAKHPDLSTEDRELWQGRLQRLQKF